jgi:hypothetical protein
MPALVAEDGGKRRRTILVARVELGVAHSDPFDADQYFPQVWLGSVYFQILDAEGARFLAYYGRC